MTSGLLLALAVLGGLALAPAGFLGAYFAWLLAANAIEGRREHLALAAATRQSLNELNAEYRQLCEGVQQ